MDGSGTTGATRGQGTTGMTGNHGTTDTTGTSGTTTGKKPSLMDRLNPMKDTDGDGKKGMMD